MLQNKVIKVNENSLNFGVNYPFKSETVMFVPLTNVDVCLMFCLLTDRF